MRVVRTLDNDAWRKLLRLLRRQTSPSAARKPCTASGGRAARCVAATSPVDTITFFIASLVPLQGRAARAARAAVRGRQQTFVWRAPRLAAPRA